MRLRSPFRRYTVLIILFLTWFEFVLAGHQVFDFGKVIYAVNAGGGNHVDVYGIQYEPDMCEAGFSSSHGKYLVIGRVPAPDQMLYQTERYHHRTFGYDIPVQEDGEYVMILKFSEVYFNAPNMKVFDVVLNGDHTIVSELDIFDRVGRGVAHDEYIPFSIVNGRLYFQDEESEIVGGKIRVEFIKGDRDNPKINAIVVIKGRIEDIPKLTTYTKETEFEEFHEEPEEKNEKKKFGRPSGPRTPDPYAIDDSSIMLPVLVAVGAFIPLLFCLCKL